MKMQAQLLATWKSIKKGYKICGIILLSMLIVLSLRLCSTTEIEPVAQQLVQISDIIRKKFSAKPDFWKLNTQWLIDNQVLPNSMVKDGKIINLLGEEVVVGFGIEGQMLMPGAKSFDIVYKNLNHSECVGLASYAFAEQQVLGLLSLVIINGAEEKHLDWSEDGGLPLSADEAQKLCSSQNMLIWNFE